MSIALFLRRLRLVKGVGELSPPETLALKRLARVGPSTPGALAKLEQISPQGMGATLSGLEHARAGRSGARILRTAGGLLCR